MSKVKSTVEETKELPPLFAPVDLWCSEKVKEPRLPGREVMHFVEEVISVTQGVQLLLEIRTTDNLSYNTTGEAEPVMQHLLREGDHVILSRLCATSLRMLSRSASSFVDLVNERHDHEGNTEKEGDNHG